ncbi:methyltransferase domain-containing protein [Aurantimonas sp. VKM B-3413]|uniref:methyltransferase domain-containing protein n=1 Tax=Aurantimonas sp. VKM B-3413 TaxID=2779401 RepID=UPI001E4511E8|nr:methyltransferase domain-containing protein [Aurantimonas sp. VKM B-3413]MCB8839409.1 methyltransferase domain-containing protein [Aurantimonas sp. VKM B-3413]
MQDLTLSEREEFARKFKTMVLYFGDEVPAAQAAEEEAALRALPRGYDLGELNGLNIGCGNRTIHPAIVPVDIMRKPPADQIAGSHPHLSENALLSAPDDLPFKEGSLDYIVALHMLEHIGDPVSLVRYWLSLLKPGGGLGIVLPDWHYTWDARFDRNTLGHKWNCTPALVRQLYEEHWRDLAELEHLDTYPYRISFDFVLRKHGTFVPFRLPDASTFKSGFQLEKEGRFLHGE